MLQLLRMIGYLEGVWGNSPVDVVRFHPTTLDLLSLVMQIKERFSLLGARNFPESAQRRTHRRRRSGGESSAGSGSSAGLAAAIGGLTVWR